MNGSIFVKVPLHIAVYVYKRNGRTALWSWGEWDEITPPSLGPGQPGDHLFTWGVEQSHVPLIIRTFYGTVDEDN
jgi:hypothetical protein